MNRLFRSAFFPLIVIVVLVWLASQTLIPKKHNADPRSRPTRDVIAAGRRRRPGQFKDVVFNPSKRSISVKVVGGKSTTVHYPSDQSQVQFQDVLQKQNVKFDSKGTGGFSWTALIGSFLPFLLLIGFWIFLMNQVQGGGSKVMSFGKSRAKRMAPDSPKIGFKDVAGVDEAVEELQEIKEFLENPKKFQALGARIPKGVLLYGPPGTGKTLLARAVAGEAGVPFFSISGSDFVEMFVGVGASRVRDLFEQAKQAYPCIIFMDEIDAVGRHRGAGLGGGHDEREQTLNQLLVEMDGFEMKDNIILIAATNRPDILDPALLRPGRFDRQIVVDRPDRNGRRKILEVHSKGKPLASVDRPRLARRRHARLHRRRSREPRQRGSAARRAPRQEGDRAGGAGGGDHARDRRPGEEGAAALGEGAAHHGVPRDGPRARRPLPREHRPGAQDHDRVARPGARSDRLAADRGSLPDDAQGAARADRDDDGRARRRGARLQRDHDRRRRTTSRRSPRPRRRW